MEYETIIYFYPMEEWNGERSPAKSHWWQQPRLKSCQIMSCKDFAVTLCPVPKLYYRKQSWKPEILEEAMENVCCEAEGMTDTFLHSAVEKLMPEEMWGKWRPRQDTIKKLAERQIAEKTKKRGLIPDRAVIRLGNAEDVNRQMEMTWDILFPYLPKINNCIIYYEKIPDADIREELEGFLEDYYYEYGLVVQMEAYGAGRSGGAKADRLTEATDLYLDYRQDNLFRSLRKYLDTMVKNGYDK